MPNLEEFITESELETLEKENLIKKEIINDGNSLKITTKNNNVYFYEEFNSQELKFSKIYKKIDDY